MTKYYTYWDQEQDSGNHGCECCATKLARIDIAQEADCEGADRRDDVGTVEDEMVCNLVCCVRCARDYNHHDQIPVYGLFVVEGRENGEYGDNDELRPPGKRLEVPRKERRAEATFGDVGPDKRRRRRKRE